MIIPNFISHLSLRNLGEVHAKHSKYNNCQYNEFTNYDDIFLGTNYQQEGQGVLTVVSKLK